MVFHKEVHQRGAKEISSCGKTKEFKIDAMNCLILGSVHEKCERKEAMFDVGDRGRLQGQHVTWLHEVVRAQMFFQG